MPFRVLIKGDSHYGLVSGGVRRTEEVDEVYRRIVDRALKERVDLFVDLGDLSDKGALSPRATAMIISNLAVLSAAGIPVLLLGGNHDSSNRPDAEHALEPFAVLPPGPAPLKVATEVCGWRPRPDAEVLCLPYVHARRLPADYAGQQDYYDRLSRAWLASSAAEVRVRDPARDPARLAASVSPAGAVLYGAEARARPRYRLAVAHLNLQGARKAAGDALVRDVDVQVPTFLLGRVPVFCGHLHAYQVFEEPGKLPAVVVGSTQYVDFGEAADPKGYVLYDCPEERW